MEEFLFWKRWNTFQKAILLILFSVFIFSFGFYVFFASQGINNVLGWETNLDIDNLTIGFDQFSRYMIDFNIEAENFITSQFYVPSPYNTHADYGIVYFCLIAFCATIFLTVVSSVKKIYWFSGLITIFMAWLTFLHLDTIGLFGVYNKIIFIAIFVAFVGLAFYFQTYAETASWGIRLMSFGLLMSVFLILTSVYSDVPDALFLLSANSYVVIAISVVFIFLVSYDILTLFLVLNAKSKSFNPKSNIYNFLAISGLYLAIPLLLFFQNLNLISFNVSYFNVNYLLAVSAIVGIWAQQFRSPMFKGNLPFQPIGAILMVVLAIITFSTIAYAHATWNTPVIKFFSQIILYSHVAFGVSFFAYAALNFTPLLMKNIDISKQIFTHKGDLPYYTVRITGFVLFFVILNIKNFSALNDLNAGYNNYKGDVSYHLQDDLMADYYYKKASINDHYNFKSNYPLVELNIKKYKYQKAKEHIENALFSEPHPLIYSANQYIHELNNDAFYNIWKLEEGVSQFPNDPFLKNNLAITYQKEGVKNDTCLYLYDQALTLVKNPSMIQSNMVVYCAKNNLLNEADSLMMSLDLGKSISLESNKYAVWNALKKPATQPEETFIADTNLNVVTYTFLHNAVFRQLPNNTAMMDKIKYLLSHYSQSVYATDLKFLKGIQQYYSGKHKDAKQTFDEVLVDCKTSLYPYYANIFGHLMFKIEADDIAREYFRKAHESQQFAKINKSPLYYAFSSAHVLDSDSLASLFRNVSQYDSTYKYYAIDFASMIQSKNATDLKSLQDYQKVQYLEISKHALDRNLAEEIINSFEDFNLKALACSKLIERILKKGDVDLATHLYGFVPSNISNRFVASEVHTQFLNLLYHRKSYDQLLEQSEKLDFVKEDYYKVLFFKAKANLEKRNLKQVEDLLEKLNQLSPLYTKAIVLKAEYLNLFKKDLVQAYDLLIDAIELNPTSTELKKAYTLVAIDRNMDVFAETTLEELSYTLPNTEFIDFKKAYNERKAIAEENFNNWE